MRKLKGAEIGNALKNGDIIYVEESNFIEKRLYRLKNNNLEYSDDNLKWSTSKLGVEDLEKYICVKIK